MTGQIIAKPVSEALSRFNATCYNLLRLRADARDLEWLKEQVSAAVSAGDCAQNM